jgi:FKBP-type peptidyl-prolyl cis-trans isomerase
MAMTLRFVLVAALLALVRAGTRPEDIQWLQAKAKEDGVVATGTGLLYKGASIYMCADFCCLFGIVVPNLMSVRSLLLTFHVSNRLTCASTLELRAGTGPTPTIDSPCDCHYAGTLIDGTEFDSSYKRGAPLTFAPNQVIKGWTEAMQLMKEGGKWELYIPSELAYGDHGAGAAIPGGAALIFTLELLKVKGDSVQNS